MFESRRENWRIRVPEHSTGNKYTDGASAVIIRLPTVVPCALFQRDLCVPVDFDPFLDFHLDIARSSRVHVQGTLLCLFY